MQVVLGTEFGNQIKIENTLFFIWSLKTINRKLLKDQKSSMLPTSVIEIRCCLTE